MASVDVTVMGAGAFGLSIAWVCVQRGARVRVIDPNGVASGASGGIVGALAPHVPEQWNEKKAFQLKSLLMAENFWADVENVGGGNAGYARLGRWQPISDQAAFDLARRREHTAQELWRDDAEWRIIPNPGGEWAPDSATGYLIEDTLSARLHPRRACEALAAAIRANGGEITAQGVSEGKVVWATGWQGLQDMTAAHHRLVGAGVKGQAVLFHYDASDLPQLFADTLHIIPHADGTVAVGSTTERDFDDPTTPDAQAGGLIDKARVIVPALKDAPVIGKWAGVRPRSRTRAPILGAHPQRKGEFIANGGFKIGFGMAPLAAECMADLLLNGRADIPESFDPLKSL